MAWMSGQIFCTFTDFGGGAWQKQTWHKNECLSVTQHRNGLSAMDL